jgi:hypothetical protein
LLRPINKRQLFAKSGKVLPLSADGTYTIMNKKVSGSNVFSISKEAIEPLGISE